MPSCIFVSDCCCCYGKSCAGTIFRWCYGTPADANVSSILQDTAEQSLNQADFFLSAEIQCVSDTKFIVQLRNWNPHINCVIASHCSSSNFRCPTAGISLFCTRRTQRARNFAKHQQASIATQVNRTLWSYFWWGKKWYWYTNVSWPALSCTEPVEMSLWVLTATPNSLQKSEGPAISCSYRVATVNKAYLLVSNAYLFGLAHL